MTRVFIAMVLGLVLGGCVAQAVAPGVPAQLANAVVTIIVNAIGYAAVRRDVVALRKQHQNVVEDHEHRLTVLERRPV